ncbi:unnamed protein product [Somion occarium]|uniref:F-box domain-containing protein n=1 Tax=Somion occarium TaxID=3059160 RepID=A0ABP1D4D7_9APHY
MENNTSSHASTPSLTDLPTELIVQILHALDFLKDLLRCKQSCKLLDTVVDNNTYLQYQVRLGLNGMQDGTSTKGWPVSDRLRALCEYEKGWDKLQFKEGELIDMDADDVWDLYGNVISQTKSFSGGRLVATQLPSRVRRVSKETWVLDKLPVRYRDFAMDVAQDLLVLMEISDLFQAETLTYYIHLRTLYAGDAHPLAIHARLSYARAIDAFTYHIRISSEYVAIEFCSVMSSTENVLCIWNWKTGQLQMEMVGLLAYNFLTDHHIMLIRHNQGGLHILDLNAVSPGGTRAENVEYVCSFLFPPLHSKLHDVEIRIDPGFSWSPDPKLAIPFSTAAGKRLVAVTLNGMMTFLIPSDTLLPHFYNLPNITSNHQIAWSDWGLKGTRAFSTFSGHSSTWCRNVYGMRFVDLIENDDDTQTIFIADVNQTAVRKASLDSDLAIGSNEDPEHMKVILHSTTTMDLKLFKDPVTTSLPYRWKELPIISDVHYDGAMVTEDAVILVRDDTRESSSYLLLEI